MGGKTKQSQRTKNNVRPSSSSRSAELLSGAVSAEGGLVNPSTGKVLPALFPTLAAGAANFEQGLNPEFQMCIKKLNKKDPITKTKALQELCELVNKGNVEDVVAALPSWAHFYKILTVDTDRKVREMTQVCHGAVVRASGRRAAPALRRLLPAWLQAQYDDHAPAAAAANNSLKNTFPDSKLPEVISFCKAEVIAHITDNLIGDAAAVISKKTESPEEKELQLCRVVTSSLQGLQYFAQHLPPAQHDWLWAELQPLLHHAAFWALERHAALHIRAAWYGAMGSIIARYGSTFGSQHGARSLRLLLAAARAAAPPLAAPLWGCLLLLMHHVQDWHSYLDKKELLVKRILDVLENGGWGDARHLSDMLLPLLANLPRDMLTKHFYETFFKAIYVGLENKKVLNSKSERQSWITSLAECLRYLSIQQEEFAAGVASAAHRTWLEHVLAAHLDTHTRTNLIKCSSTNMASLLKYWLKLSKEENGDKYDQLVRNFWQNVGSTILAQIDKCSVDRDEIGQLIDGHILLVQSLRTSLTQEPKKQRSIKFDGDPQPAASSPPPPPSAAAAAAHRYTHNLDELVQMICSHYFEFASKKEISSAILSPLITLLVEFDSKNLFLAIARQFDVDTVYKLYDKVLRGWLAGDTMRCEAAVDVVFLMMKHLTDDEQDMMFDTFQQFPPLVEEWIVSRCAAHPHRAGRAARAWLSAAPAARCVRRVCARALHPGDSRARNLLLMCLSADHDDEILISESAVSDVLESVAAAVAAGAREGAGAGAGGALERAAALAARVAAALPARASPPALDHFLFALFELNVQVPRGSELVSVETWCEVRSCWQDAAAALPPAARLQLLQRAAAALHQHLAQLTEELNIPRLEHMVSVCPHLFPQAAAAAAPADVSEVAAFTQLLFDLPDDSQLVTACAVRHECVTSQLSCLDDTDNHAIRTVIEQSSDSDVTELTRAELLPHVTKLLFRAIYLRTMLLYKPSEDEDEQCWCDALLADERLAGWFCDLLHDYAVLNSLHEGYAFWAHYSIIQESKEKLECVLSGVLAARSGSGRGAVVSILDARAAAQGYHWALARGWLRQREGGPDQGGRGEDVVSGAGFFHCMQASTRWCGDEARELETKYLVMVRSLQAAHHHQLGESFAQAVARATDTCDLDPIVDAYYKHNHTMLYDREVCTAPWVAVASNAAVVEFLCALVARGGGERGWSAPPHHWDFITITLCSLLASLEHSQHNWACTKVAMLSRSVLRLFVAVQQFVAAVPAQSERRRPAPHVAALPAEWRDVFAADTHRHIYSLATHVLASPPADSPVRVSSNHVRVVAALTAAVRRAPWALLPGGLRARELAAPALAARAAHALAAPAHHALKYLAYYLGLQLAEPLVLDDAGKLALWSEEDQAEEEGEQPQPQRPALSLDCFHDAFARLHDVVDAALAHVELGEATCETAPHSDTHSMALGWLLLAELMAAVSRLARGDLVHHHIRIYRERKYVEALLAASLRLLPAAVFAHARDHTGSAPAPHNATDMFFQVEEFNADEPVDGGAVSRLACRGVCSSVCGAGGGAARGWWGAARPRAARLLERAVQHHVAPRAARDQLLQLQRRAHEIEDAEIRIAWSTSEVSCVFNVEERRVELRVVLSRSHPLAAPRLLAPGAGGPGASTQWLALYLAYQNGTVLNALRMWTRAVSARVESAPQCYICYCRLHPASGRLPRVPCHQCNNKFHNTCLRKWFTTSNKSSCPLCRSNF